MKLNYQNIGRRIKLYRKRRGLTQNELAERIGKSTVYISYLEGGVKGLSLETLLDIVNALNLTADALLVGNLHNNRQQASEEFKELLSDCSFRERRIILDSAYALKEILREHREAKEASIF